MMDEWSLTVGAFLAGCQLQLEWSVAGESSIENRKSSAFLRRDCSSGWHQAL